MGRSDPDVGTGSQEVRMRRNNGIYDVLKEDMRFIGVRASRRRRRMPEERMR